jgi:hypothetical protein
MLNKEMKRNATQQDENTMQLVCNTCLLFFPFIHREETLLRTLYFSYYPQKERGIRCKKAY